MTHKFTEYTNSQCKPNYLIIEFGESDRFYRWKSLHCRMMRREFSRAITIWTIYLSEKISDWIKLSLFDTIQRSLMVESVPAIGSK